MDSITISDPVHHGVKTPDKDGRVYLTQELAKQPVHVYVVRAEDTPEPDLEGATDAIAAVLEGAADDTDAQLRAALAALNRLNRAEDA